MLLTDSTAPNERIGRYEILGQIATGGITDLFLARHGSGVGVVVIKRVLPCFACDQEFISIFCDEARLAANLFHPQIVQIYDLGRFGCTYFIAMEYVRGQNLASIARRMKALRRRFPPAYVAWCLGQACGGLHYAHTRGDEDGRPLGIVHGGVSPRNIIVSFSGTVKLVNFGIAKAATRVARRQAEVLKSQCAYMSPEQVRGEPVDARSDVFAVGTVLYELLCGRRPFERPCPLDTLEAIAREDPVDCRRVNSDIPAPLGAVVDKALKKRPSDRYADAQELRDALEDIVRESGSRLDVVTAGRWVTELFQDERDGERDGAVDGRFPREESSDDHGWQERLPRFGSGPGVPWDATAVDGFHRQMDPRAALVFTVTETDEAPERGRSTGVPSGLSTSDATIMQDTLDDLESPLDGFDPLGGPTDVEVRREDLYPEGGGTAHDLDGRCAASEKWRALGEGGASRAGSSDVFGVVGRIPEDPEGEPRRSSLIFDLGPSTLVDRPVRRGGVVDRPSEHGVRVRDRSVCGGGPAPSDALAWAVDSAVHAVHSANAALLEGAEPPVFGVSEVESPSGGRYRASAVQGGSVEGGRLRRSELVRRRTFEIGSEEVPPAHDSLSHSQVLTIPSPNGRWCDSPSLPPRTASVVGRRIREAVCAGSRVLGASGNGPGRSRGAHPEWMAEPASGHLVPSNRGWGVLPTVLVVLLVSLLAGLVYRIAPSVLGPPTPLRIETSPPGARVYVDGALQLDRTPLGLHGLKPNKPYRVRVERNGYHTVEQVLRLPEGHRLIWRIPLSLELN